MIEIPRIETERLLLRAPRMEDFETVAAFLASERTRFMDGPYERSRAWKGFAATVGAWVLQGFGYWTVEERGSGRPVGAVGVQHPAEFPEDELGWELYDGYEGRGYATEAARDWAFGPGGLRTLISYIDPGNARSIRVAERLGAVRDEAAPGADPGDLVYRHSGREAWR